MSRGAFYQDCGPLFLIVKIHIECHFCISEIFQLLRHVHERRGNIVWRPANPQPRTADGESETPRDW